MKKGLYYKLQDENIKEKEAVIYNLTTNLFQFIKERRRISDSRTIERRIEMNIIELLEKIYNGEIKDDTIFYGGDLFYKLIVVDKKLYTVNTRTLDLKPVESNLIGNFVVNNYKIYEYKMVLD